MSGTPVVREVDGGHRLVAEIDGTLVATVSWRRGPGGGTAWYEREDVAIIDELVVKPQARKLGVGTMLLSEVECRARAGGVTEVAGDIAETDTSVVHWLKRRAYRLVGFVRRDAGENVILSKSLTPIVEIVPSSTDWYAAFASAAAVLAVAFESRALRIDHIGSTAVPGLIAKDQIDIQVGVETLNGVVDQVGPRLLGAGFTLSDSIGQDHLPPGWSGDPSEWIKRFASGRTGDRPVNVHIRRVGAANWRYALLFRDYLVTHPETASAYGEAKVHLAGMATTRLTYVLAKDPICDLVFLAAEDWADRVGWMP